MLRIVEACGQCASCAGGSGITSFAPASCVCMRTRERVHYHKPPPSCPLPAPPVVDRYAEGYARACADVVGALTDAIGVSMQHTVTPQAVTELWEHVHAYVRACGGSPDADTMNLDAAMRAVVQIERLVAMPRHAAALQHARALVRGLAKRGKGRHE